MNEKKPAFDKRAFLYPKSVKTAWIKRFSGLGKIILLKIESQKNEENKRKTKKNKAINL